MLKGERWLKSIPENQLDWFYFLYCTTKPLIDREAYWLSYDNGFYDWGLRTQRIENMLDDLIDGFQMLYEGKINLTQFMSYTQLYFQAVYDETLRVWEERKAYCRIKYNVEIKELPVESIKLPQKELDFITERWAAWASRDNEPCIGCTFDNDIVETDFSYIVFDYLIHNRNHVLGFGNYRKETVDSMFTLNPKYLEWAYNYTDRLRLDDVLHAELKQWLALFKQDGRYD